MTIKETHLFLSVFNFGEPGSLWLLAFHKYLHSYSWTHTLVTSLGHNPDVCIKQKKGRARAKKTKKRGKCRCKTTAWKLQLKQYQWQKRGKMGNCGWWKKKNPPHTGSSRCCGSGKGLRAALGRVLCQSCWVGTNFWFQISYCLLRICLVTG